MNIGEIEKSNSYWNILTIKGCRYLVKDLGHPCHPINSPTRQLIGPGRPAYVPLRHTHFNPNPNVGLDARAMTRLCRLVISAPDSGEKAHREPTITSRISLGFIQWGSTLALFHPVT